MAIPLDHMSAATKVLKSVIAPLTESEEQKAIAAATASLRADLSDRHRILGTELRIDKPAHGKLPDRIVGVYVVDYLKHRVFEALVDSTGKVVALNDLPPYQLPISRDEIREAEHIAAHDEHVARAVQHQKTMISPFAPHDHTSKKRIVGLHYFQVEDQKTHSPHPIGDVEVDLAQRTVKFTAAKMERR